ncbi:hypothetical protein RHMOL_Rhmol11G0056100 [Rhododendron molle]|uniref:Uncharacterized protein n=1 Tax=Rhododendron molle TaxID=49168 RepID=A0ACC0LPY9_RHOML|nr:hypothetical protein RHMOL_Rhmol11G0056100 [Rhododendron molle]
MGNPVFEVGMEFKTHAQFRDAVKEHSIKGGKAITFFKSDRDKVRAKCRDGCPWLIYASYVPSDVVYRIKRYDSEHSCNRSFHVPWVSTKWILNKYKERIRRNPTWPVKSLADTIMGEHTVNVDIQKVYRARKMALEMIQGSAVVKKRDAMKRCKWPVCPKVYKRVEKLKENSDGWIPRWQGSDRFEVEGPGNGKYKVCGSSANRNATHGSNANSNAVKRPKVTVSTNKDMFFCSKSLTYVFFSPNSASLWE